MKTTSTVSPAPFLQVSDYSRMAHSPTGIHRLPDDVLYALFREFVEMHHLDATAAGNKLEPRCNSWIRALTHVCQRWRIIAINAPLLWTNIVFGNADGTAAFFQRARGSPVSVAGRIGYTADDELIRGTLGTVLEHSDQVVALDVLLPTFDPPIFSTFGRRTFSKLATLSLERTDESMFNIQEQITFPPFFGAGDSLPDLKELRVRRYPIPVVLRSGILVYKLRKFEFMTHFYDPLPMDAMLEALGGMPLLEELIISGSITPQWQTVTSPIPLARTASLLCLRSLSLRSVARGASAFLVYLFLSPNATVKLSLTNEDHITGDDYIEAHDAIIPTIAAPIADIPFSAAAFDPSQRITALAIHIADDYLSKFRVRAWNTPSPLEELSPHEKAFLRNDDGGAPEPSLDVTMDGYSSVALIQHLCAALPLEHVQLLFVCNSDRYSGIANIPMRRAFRALFTNMPGLLRMSTTVCAIGPLPMLLRPVVGEPGGQTLLPHLKQLNITDAMPPGPPMLWQQSSEEWMKELKESLAERRDFSFTSDLISGSAWPSHHMS